MARRRFFVQSIERGHAKLYGDEAAHLTRVLRVEAGRVFEISDNQRVYLAEVETACKDLVAFRIVEEIAPEPVRPHTSVLAALIKFEHFEWMIEKATELGVETIVPVSTERSERGLESAARKRLDRWRRIAREASEQSRRARMPEIDEPAVLAAALSNSSRYRYVLEESSAPAILSVLPEIRTPRDQVALLVGPEGGWTDRERAEIHAAGWTAVSLGPLILRAETAAIAALAVIHAAWNSGAAR